MTTRIPAAVAHRQASPRRLTCTLTALLSLALAAAGGCTTTTHLHPQTAAPDNALANVPVTVTTHDGRSIRMEVSESSAEYLVGTDAEGLTHTIPLPDIRSLEITRFSAGKTTALTLGIVGVVAGAALIAVVDSGFPPMM